MTARKPKIVLFEHTAVAAHNNLFIMKLVEFQDKVVIFDSNKATNISKGQFDHAIRAEECLKAAWITASDELNISEANLKPAELLELKKHKADCKYFLRSSRWSIGAKEVMMRVWRDMELSDKENQLGTFHEQLILKCIEDSNADVSVPNVFRANDSSAILPQFNELKSSAKQYYRKNGTNANLAFNYFTRTRAVIQILYDQVPKGLVEHPSQHIITGDNGTFLLSCVEEVLKLQSKLFTTEQRTEIADFKKKWQEVYSHILNLANVYQSSIDELLQLSIDMAIEFNMKSLLAQELANKRR